MAVELRIIGKPEEVAVAAARIAAALGVLYQSPQRPAEKRPGSVRVYMRAEADKGGEES